MLRARQEGSRKGDGATRWTDGENVTAGKDRTDEDSEGRERGNQLYGPYTHLAENSSNAVFLTNICAYMHSTWLSLDPFARKINMIHMFDLSRRPREGPCSLDPNHKILFGIPHPRARDHQFRLFFSHFLFFSTPSPPPRPSTASLPISAHDSCLPTDPINPPSDDQFAGL